MSSSLLRAAFACIALYFSFGPGARGGEITLAGAIDTALKRNPDLIASRYELTAAQARIVSAGARINPTLGVELENFAGAGTTRGVDALETTLSLSQVIELGGKRHLRVASAEADLQLAEVDQRARELDVLAEVTRRFIDVVVAQERLRIAQETSALSRQTFAAISRQVDVARSPLAERSRAQIALTRALIEEQQTASELRAARYSLAAVSGDAEPAFSSATADLFRLQSAPSFLSFVERLERAPEFLRFASQRRLREAELRLAQAQARSDVTLSLGVRRFEETDDAALIASFSVPLAIYDRNQGAIRAASVRREQTDAEQQAAFARTRAGLFGLYQQMLTSSSRSQTLREEALPQARLALEQTQSGYDRGRFSFLDLATTQQELSAIHAAAIDAAADYHRLRAEIERVTGTSLAASEASLP
jgi:outer membrane protein, heavy metal efflux system